MSDAAPAAPARMLTAAFTLSGFAALMYEVTWARLFALHVGGQAEALAALLASYLGGLALGGWAGGRFAPRSRRPLRTFAALEAGTAVLGALAFPLLGLLEPMVGSLYRGHLDGGPSFVLTAAALSAAAIFPAAFLMGATLPAVVAGRRGAGGAAAAGRLYAWNTAGAVGGTLAAGLLLLPALGNSRTIFAAAGVNLLAAGMALRLDRRAAPAAPPPAASSTAAPAGRGNRWLLLGIGLAGGASLVSQIGWTRTLTLLLGSSTYAFTVILAVFLAGLALGARGGARLAARDREATPALVAAQAGAALAALVAVGLLGRLPLWLVPPLARAGAGMTLTLLVQATAAALVVLPPTLFLGAAFPLAVRARSTAARSPARASGEVYAAGSAGMVLGALLAGGPLFPWAGLRGALVLSSFAFALAGVLIALGSQVPVRGVAAARSAVGVASVGLLAAALPAWEPAVLTAGPFLYAPLYRASARAGGGSVVDAVRGRGEILHHAEGRAATVTVRRTAAGTRSLQINGKTDASTGGDMVTQLLAGHLPALLARDGATDALVIGLASGVSLGAVERYPFRRIDCIELLPEVVDAAELFADASGGALDDPRLRLEVGDGRNHLFHSGRSYDVIASQPTNPWVAGTAALFTRETFEAARARLREGGVLGQWIQGYALLAEDFRSVVATFLAVFPAATLWEESPGGGDYFLIGWRSPRPELDVPLLRARMRVPEVAADLARAGIEDTAGLLAHFVAGPAALATFAAGAPLQVDDRTALEFTAARALMRDTLPDQVRGLRRHRESPAHLLGGLDPAVDADLLRDLRRSRAAARREERLVLSLSGTQSPDALVDADLMLGAELLRSGLPGPAALHLERAAAAQPDLPEPQILLGHLHWRAGNLPAARAALRSALAIRPEDAAARAVLARVEIDAGDPAAAAEQVEAALAAQPDDAEFLNLAGAVALLAGAPDAALAPLERALELDPEFPEAWVNLGVARRQTGDLPGALEAYQYALALEPSNLDARYNLGVALLTAGLRGEAAAEFAAVLRADPTDAGARQRWTEATGGGSGPTPLDG